MGEGKQRCHSGPWDEGGRRGAQGTFPCPSRDSGEGGEVAVHMPISVTYVTEKHFFLAKGL